MLRNIIFCALFLWVCSQQFENCTRASSKWQKYVCKHNGKVQKQCFPQRWAPPRTIPARGAIAIFHGFSACPDSFSHMSSVLAQHGFYVYSFLTIGHGALFNKSCQSNDCVNGDNVATLPKFKSGYISFVDEANTIFREEVRRLSLPKDAMIGAMGLSLGSALATVAVARAQTLYHRALLFNPFYGITVPALDAQLSNCTMSMDECVQALAESVIKQLNSNCNASLDASFLFQQKIIPATIKGGYAQMQSYLRNTLTAIGETSFLLPPPLDGIIEKPMGWGQQCETDRVNQNRGGFCSFQVRNLLAAHSFGQFAVEAANRIRSTRVQFVTVERDGITRNALIFQAAQNVLYKKAPVAACMHRIAANCTPVDNRCGVPHSMIAAADNLGIPPYRMYWEPQVIKYTIQFFERIVNDIGVEQWDNDPTLCVKQDIANPDRKLVGPIPRGIILTSDAE